MSLDVYLELKSPILKDKYHIYIREDGEVKEISLEEWDDRFPGREPSVATEKWYDTEVYSANITHNLAKMAGQAGLYGVVWRPEENKIEKAAQLIPFLIEGIGTLEENPEHFKQFNPRNGWGDYEGLVSWLKRYLGACEEYPEATVRASR